jgi:hypothetical protein
VAATTKGTSLLQNAVKKQVKSLAEYAPERNVFQALKIEEVMAP